jgi:RPC5 protein
MPRKFVHLLFISTHLTMYTCRRFADQVPPADDDPVVASYSVHLTTPNAPSSNPAADTSTGQKLLVLQYPAHRLADTPYNAQNLQKPKSLRLKPSSGILELDIPIDTKLNYNSNKGSAYATSLKRSRIVQENSTHGLSGGFNTGPVGRNIRQEEELDINTIPAHSSPSNDSVLSVQTLAGKIVTPSPGDSIYMLGSFQNSSLHLSHLDALVQVRPELHHLDAADELERIRNTSAFAQRAKGKDDGDIALPPPLPGGGQSNRPESKAIDIKLKPSGPSSSHDNDLSTNSNARLLRAIQQEPWQTYEWIDEDETESHQMSKKALHLPHLPGEPGTKTTSRLESAITNSEWLDLMSAPRLEHGKKGDKGLMSKVRGRERERQRRKRNEAARREKEAATTTRPAEETGDHLDEGGHATAAEDTADDQGRAVGPSDEESSDDENEEQERVGTTVRSAGQRDGVDEDEVQEVHRPEPTAAGPAPPRRRGRPRKSQAEDPIVVDD